MRIHLHDGSGHPFQVQLSRELAGRGHEVLHTYATQWVSGHGLLSVQPDDPPTLRIEGITARWPYDKYSPRKRALWEVSYASAWQRVLAREQWDVVISCNTQLIAAARMRRYFRRKRQPWLLWHQDIASFGFADEAARKLPGPLAGFVRRAVIGTEKRIVRDASAVVAIGEPFLAQYREWGVPAQHATVIPNWAPLDEITPLPRDEVWAAGVGVPVAELRLLYAGTLGRKHNPQLLLDLLAGVRATGIDAQLVVASEGPGADYLIVTAQPHVHVLPFQPVEDLSAMLAAGDVLLAILEPEASRFSIPSKVLSYLAAGRAVLTFAPATNPCVSDVVAGGGLVVEPTMPGLSSAVDWVAGELRAAAAREAIGARARGFALANFDIAAIGDRFERILRTADRAE